MWHLLPTCLLGLSSRSGVYFLFSLIWDGFVTCFDQKNETEVTLHQDLKSFEACTFTILETLRHHEKESTALLDREAIWRETFQSPQLELQTCEWSQVSSSSPNEPHQPIPSGAEMSCPHQALFKWENHGQKHGCCCFKSVICRRFFMQQQINSVVFSGQNSSFRGALSNSSLFCLSHCLSPVLSNFLFLS